MREAARGGVPDARLSDLGGGGGVDIEHRLRLCVHLQRAHTDTSGHVVGERCVVGKRCVVRSSREKQRCTTRVAQGSSSGSHRGVGCGREHALDGVDTCCESFRKARANQKPAKAVAAPTSNGNLMEYRASAAPKAGPTA
jgi:hypothetical protein